MALRKHTIENMKRKETSQGEPSKKVREATKTRKKLNLYYCVSPLW